MRSCIVFFLGKGKHTKNSWCSDFMSKRCARVSVLYEITIKIKARHEQKKTHDLI